MQELVCAGQASGVARVSDPRGARRAGEWRTPQPPVDLPTFSPPRSLGTRDPPPRRSSGKVASRQEAAIGRKMGILLKQGRRI